MKLGFLPVVLGISVASAFAACGGSTTSSPAAPAADAGTTVAEGGSGGGDDAAPDAAAEAAPPPLDHGTPSSTYPAFKVDLPQLNKNDGMIFDAPVVVSVTWETDPNAAQIDAFTDQIGTSDYWKAIVSEYGIGVATSGGHVHIPVDATHPLPTTMSDDEVSQLIDDSANAPTTSGWPAPTPQTIYMVYAHPDIAMTSGGVDACTVYAGFHDQTNSNYAFALSLPCTAHHGTFADLTVTGSHELGEAATDPSPGGGYIGFDTANVAWSMFQHGATENGDACEYYNDANDTEKAPFAFVVQRLWSNAAAAAGKNPCVPATPGPFFGVTPTALEDVSYTGRQGAIMTKGINIPVGTTKTFPVGFFSEAALTGPMTAVVHEAFTPNANGATAPHLTVSIDKTTGLNGEIAYVSVTVNKAGVTLDGRNYTKANFVTVLSSYNGTTHYMPILITNN